MDGVHIAFQSLGSGPPDLVFAPGFVSNVETVWDWSLAEAFLRRLGSMGRVAIFDRRGTGLSDHILPAARQMTLEARVDDIRAVMDEIEMERAVLIGFEDGFKDCAMYAATYPDRTAALVSYGANATWRIEPDYPWGWSSEQVDAWLETVDTTWGTRAFALAQAAVVWPGLDDPDWIDVYAAHMRRSVSPGDAVSLFRVDSETDVRGILPSILVPTLIVHRTDDRAEPVGQAHYLSQQIPGATVVEIPGAHHGFMAPDQELFLAEVQRFVERIRGSEAELDRVLATVLFTDIVGSTERAAELGDRAWASVIERHHAIVRTLLGRFRGREIDTAGDGFFAAFDGPARAVRCAQAIGEAVRGLELEIRAGVHTGEVETIDGKVGGIAVAMGARVAALAGASEVLVSQTVKDLTAGSGLAFEDAGEHELKGVPDRWRLYRVTG